MKDFISFALLKKNYKKYLRSLLYLVTILSIIEGIIIFQLSVIQMESKKENIKHLIRTEGVDLNLMCFISECTSITINNMKYVEHEGIIRKEEFTPPERSNILDFLFTREYTLDNDTNTILIKMSNMRTVKTISVFFFINFIIILIVFHILFFYIRKNKLISDLKDKRYYRSQLEDSLQRNITESVHHEMSMPIAIIRTLCTDLQEKTEETHRKGKGIVKLCTVSSDYFPKIMSSIERLESVLSHMSNIKHIKYSSSPRPLYSLITSAVDSVNNFVVNKMTLRMSPRVVEKLKSVTLNVELLSNGDLLNILYNHVQNSFEAHSTTIIIKIEKLNSKYLSIYLGDNGKGIKNETGWIKDNKVIFKYGFSTKDVNGREDKTQHHSFRGSGLFYNKQIIEKATGSITLVDTRHTGTIFRIKVPILHKGD